MTFCLCVGRHLLVPFHFHDLTSIRTDIYAHGNRRKLVARSSQRIPAFPLGHHSHTRTRSSSIDRACLLGHNALRTYAPRGLGSQCLLPCHTDREVYTARENLSFTALSLARERRGLIVHGSRDISLVPSLHVYTERLPTL